jgi:hypothetical protein
MEQLNDAILLVETSNGGKVRPSKVFKLLDMDNDSYITPSDLQRACEKYSVVYNGADIHALFSALDTDDNGSVEIGEFTRNYTVHQGSILDKMQLPIKSVYHEGGVRRGGPLQDKLDALDEAVAEGKTPGNVPALGQLQNLATGDNSCSVKSARTRRSSGEHSARSQLAGGMSARIAGQGAEWTAEARISDVIRARVTPWKPHISELHTSMPKTRFGVTCYPDTRHVTEPSVPFSGAYLMDSERFKTMNGTRSIFSVPDARDPQVEDAMKTHARNEFKIGRIRQRQRDFTERCDAANDAMRDFDELKVARKAMNQLNYERRCQMSCT